MENNQCRNCGEITIKEYCSNCGEKKYKRINMKDVVGDFLSNLIAIENPILRTIIDLSLRPGIMIDNYLNGKRKIYYKPFQYYLLATTIYFLFFYLWGNELMSIFSDFGANTNTTASIEELNNFQLEFTEFLNKHMRLFTFLQVPIYAWLIWLFFGRKKKHSFTESLVVSLYVTAQVLIFGVISTLLVLVNAKLSIFANLIFSFIYFPWVMIYLYKLNKLHIIFKSFIIVVLGFILFGIIMIIVSMFWYILFR
ncbi:MAG: DUF3667 domain-containing protein [Flavobacteriales bacterium]|nr:DUF3667 domain-containing protein [Flavobacteriales bacterium]MBX2958542.1 DUF3667 domain-containing protein [Flavobacteriales bacterium]